MVKKLKDFNYDNKEEKIISYIEKRWLHVFKKYDIYYKYVKDNMIISIRFDVREIVTSKDLKNGTKKNIDQYINLLTFFNNEKELISINNNTIKIISHDVSDTLERLEILQKSDNYNI